MKCWRSHGGPQRRCERNSTSPATAAARDSRGGGITHQRGVGRVDEAADEPENDLVEPHGLDEVRLGRLGHQRQAVLHRVLQRAVPVPLRNHQRRRLRPRLADLDGGEVLRGRPKLALEDGAREVVAVVQEEGAAVDHDRGPHAHVLGAIAPVAGGADGDVEAGRILLGQQRAPEEEREGVPPRVGLVDLQDLNCAILEVHVDDVRPPVAVQPVP